MNYKKQILIKSDKNQYGGMLIELLLSIALLSLMLPFLFSYQEQTIKRAENIKIVNQMNDVQNSLERYIVMNREKLLQSIGRNITRVSLSDLLDYGLSENIIEKYQDKYELRIIKNTGKNNRSILQGIILLSDNSITPIRTNEILEVGSSDMGFVDNAKVYGNFGTWRSTTADLGFGNKKTGIIKTSNINKDDTLYLWRLPSELESDASMLNGLNMGNHDIDNITLLSGTEARYSEFFSATEILANTVTFENETYIDGGFKTKTANVFGNLSADSRSMEVSGHVYLTGVGKFSKFTTDNLWVNTLNLSGLSLVDDDIVASMYINQTLDVMSGSVHALYMTVGFTGSITPKLIVKSKIEDAVDTNYYWDATNAKGVFYDVSLGELSRLTHFVIKQEGNKNSESSKIFKTVVSNNNATVSDYINAIKEIEIKVRAKYNLLNLE